MTSSRRGVRDVASSSRGGGDVASSSNTAEEGPIFSTRELDRHYFGNFSTAVIQANINLENYSQVEVGSKSTFVGVYDGHGHGGHQVAEHVCDNLTKYLMEYVTITPTMSGNVFRHAFEKTEESWLEHVNERFANDPYIAARGTCCLVGVIWRGNLHVANVGDSRAILGSEVEDSHKIVVQQLTRDDNVRDPVVRAEVLGEHPDEPHFIVEDETAKGVYRIKGRIQVSKSIGDAYLKIPRFNLDLVDPKFVLNTPVLEGRPALSAVPLTSTIPIEPQHRFVIFASDGLWDLMSNQEVADFVQENNPKEGIAARLIRKALTKLAVKAEGRQQCDISVVVIFFDHTLQLEADIPEEFPRYSIREGSIKGYRNFTPVLDQIGLVNRNIRTVWMGNLPFGTTRDRLYSLVKDSTGGAVQSMELGPYGFYSTITFYEQEDANRFIVYHMGNLKLSGKRCCVCLCGERSYCRRFYMLERSFAIADLPYTLFIGNLPQDTTLEMISLFFNSRGIAIRDDPTIHVSREGRLYAFTSFFTLEGTEAALKLDGIQHRGLPIRIEYRGYPQLGFNEEDLLPDFI